MVNVVDRYFSLNRTLLLIVGLWPYEKSKLARLQLFCFFGILVTFITFQFTTFVTSKCTTNHIMKVFSTSFPLIGVVIQYNSFCINNDVIKCLMEQLQRIYDNVMDNNEIAIIERYGNNAKRITTMFTMLLCGSTFIISGAQLWPDFINIIFSINKSQHRLYISTEYFIDEEKYYYILLFHVITAIIIGLIVLTATGALLVAYLQHACGMFQIASYRIKNAIEIYISSIYLKNNNFIFKSLIYGIHIHRKAIMFSEHLISSFEISFIFLIMLGVITLSLNTFRIFQILSSKCNTEELPVTFIITFVSILYMFIANFIGQEIIDHYGLVFITAYEVQWYITPLYIQKWILFLLLRGNKSYGLNVGGLFIASLQCFATLANASLSYFIVMYSTQ